MNASEAWTELGGGRAVDWCDRFPEESSRFCPDCVADPGVPCTFTAEYPTPSGLRTERRVRHCPCVGRFEALGEPLTGQEKP